MRVSWWRFWLGCDMFPALAGKVKNWNLVNGTDDPTAFHPR